MNRKIALLLALILLLPATPALAESLPMELKSAQWMGDAVGQCFVPAGFTVETNVDMCTAQQSLNYPLFLSISAASPDQNVIMQYCSSRDYIHILETSTGGLSIGGHVDGQLDVTTLTPMLQFMYPSAYCDHIATTTLSGVEMIVESENSFPEAQQLFQQKAQTLYDELNATGGMIGIQTEGVYVGACERLYSFDYEGTPYYMNVTVAMSAVQSLVQSYGITTISQQYVTWEVPCTYVFACPQAQYDQYYPCFSMFKDNTCASDQFIRSNKRLANELRETALAARSLNGFSSYSSGVLSDETSSGDDYYEDRFTDYIYDNNEYALSDGSSVKVPTEYDYVYEDSNGNVVFSDSTLVDPAGATRLTPKQ